MPYQANASVLLACVFISLLKNLTLGAAIDYAATLKTHDILRAIPLFSFFKLSLGRCAMEPWRFRKTCQVT